MSFLFRRLVNGIFLLVGVSLLSFLLLDLAPGDFFDEMKLDPQVSSATVAGLRARFGLDQPITVRYFRWLSSAAHGDLGYSFAYNRPVAPLILTRAKNTLLIAGLATMFAWLLALLLGVWSAVRNGRWEARWSTGTLSIIAALPDVMIGLGLLLLAVRTKILPVGGMVSPGFQELAPLEQLKDIGTHLVLPLLALTLGLLPTLARHVRSAVVTALAAPCVRAAKAHGIGRVRLLLRHLIPLAANPLISLYGLSLATLLSTSLLIEVIMSWPGLGPFFLEAIFARDVYVVIGTVLLSTLFLVVGNFVADVLLYASDPRIRRG